MASDTFSIEPQTVPQISTNHRRITTPIPTLQSCTIIKRLRENEPISMAGQPPVVWDRAEGFHVEDASGNRWIDFTSGVLVANAGHNHPRIAQAMKDQIDQSLVHNYCFPTRVRSHLVEALVAVAPDQLDKVFLLTTGSEATECAIKLARTHGIEQGGADKITIITFANAFHGRTLGAQMAGGIKGLKQWIVNQDPNIIQLPFPDGFRNTETDFDSFTRHLSDRGFEPKQIAGVMTESYQGGDSTFAPPAYMQALRKWCDTHDVVLIFDEVQAGFGRTGKFWGFEHYDTAPDLICCGKGISSGMPISAVIGKTDIMDLYPPGSMTSTHTGNPVCAAAAIANLNIIEDEQLVNNAATVGQTLQAEAHRITDQFPNHIAVARGKGLVASLHVVESNPKETAPSKPSPPDANRARDIVMRCVQKGLMLFSPVGFSGACVKLCPPLCITEEAVREGMSVVEEAITESINANT